MDQLFKLETNFQMERTIWIDQTKTKFYFKQMNLIGEILFLKRNMRLLFFNIPLFTQNLHVHQTI